MTFPQTLCICVCVCVCVYIYIHTYIRYIIYPQTLCDGMIRYVAATIYVYMYIYIYIYIYVI